MLSIRKLTPALLAFLAVLIIPASLSAQVEEVEVCDDLIGTYELTKMDGTPPVAGAQVGVTVTANADGTLNGDVWIDRNDGNGRVSIAAEKMTIEVYCHHYEFVNARGTTGTISPYGENQYTSSTSTGHDRIWTPLP